MIIKIINNQNIELELSINKIFTWKSTIIKKILKVKKLIVTKNTGIK